MESDTGVGMGSKTVLRFFRNSVPDMPEMLGFVDAFERFCGDCEDYRFEDCAVVSA